MYLQKNFVFTKKSKNLAKYRSENSLDYQIGLSNWTIKIHRTLKQ